MLVTSSVSSGSVAVARWAAPFSCPAAVRQYACISRRQSIRRAIEEDRSNESISAPTAVNSQEEARIAALEARMRKGKSKRQIPIRNMTTKQPEVSSSNRAEWKAGKLFPEGWEEMSLGEKVAELYLGQRGMLFWANKAAWASVWVVGGAWVLFRVVGPALGLYKLQGDLIPPPI
eukprot:GHRR01014029.1.p1 GENE.GHRR01014029.1~~GHRR01014029.1.p1  ORF type:complete len:175 (-),score=41.15 GHRR01014029.1:1200-1724(-)